MVTWPGERLAQRQTTAFLDEMGLRTSRGTPDDYVSLAAALASDRERLRALRPRVRQALLESLCDGPKFTATLEAAYRTMWRRHCAGEQPEAFDVKP